MAQRAIAGRLVGMWRYPVSSLCGERMDHAVLGPRGIVGDRGFGLFDRETGTHIYPARDARWNAAARLFARLTTRGPEISTDGNDWAPADQAGTLARLAAVLGRPVDLRAYDDRSSPRYKVAPLHLLSLQAMTSLRRALPDSLIDARRFRPNLLVDLPDAEGDIPEYALLGQEFTLGGLRLRGTTPCGRCGFTTLPIGELTEDPAVLRMLVRQYERNFGIYCEVLDPGKIAAGDALHAVAPGPAVDPVVIVGGGQAGAMAARALRRLGYQGALRLYAAERHLPYERPPLSKRIARPADTPDAPILSGAEVDAAGIALHLGAPVEAIDLARRQIETADGTLSGFGTLILAQGGLARRVPGLNRGHGRVHELRTIEDAEHLAAVLRPGMRLCVLGGGWIGMEVAAAARVIGAEVSLYARTARFAPRILPPVVSEALATLHRMHGVGLHFGTDPRFHETAEGITGTIGAERFSADHLVVAIGMIPRDGIARRAGLDCADGIVTDADGATAVAGVFAIGDVARQPLGRIESWQNANLQAERAARRILGLEQAPAEPLRFWSEQFGRRLQIVGLPDPAAPLKSQEGQFWNYGHFAIGIDAPERIHLFARAIMRDTATTAAPPPAAQIPRIEYLLCAAAAVPEGALLRIDHPARGPLCVTRQAGRVHATDDACPHAVAALSEGFVEDGRLVCPLHFAEFDLTDGHPRHAPDGCGALAVHPVAERDGQLFVSLPQPAGG